MNAVKKRFVPLFLAAMLLFGAVPALARQPENAGPPEFELKTVIVPEALTVYQNQPVTFVATTTYTTNKNDNQLLHFVSDKWSGIDKQDPEKEAAFELKAEPAASVNQRLPVFVAIAAMEPGREPGNYTLTVKYEITLQHDNSGKRTYHTIADTAVITVTVMAGDMPRPEASPAPLPEKAALNHGQIVSAWAHWKQTKGNQNFLPGGPGVTRSLSWYKAQVEYRTFYSSEEVWEYLDNIYQPASREKKGPGNDKAPGHVKGPGSKKPGK